MLLLSIIDFKIKSIHTQHNNATIDNIQINFENCQIT